MRIRTLLVLIVLAISVRAEDKDFVRQGPVITPEQFRNFERNSRKQKWAIAAAARPTSRCSVPLKNLTPAIPTAKMPTISPSDNIGFTIKSVAPPAPPCEPNERQDRSERR